MGTWSHGNFDDDTAADHLGTVTARLLDEVAEAIADPAKLDPDEYWGAAVPCNLEIVNLLVAQGWAGVTLPEPRVARSWKATYLKVWDAHIDALAPRPEFKVQRRKTLVRTFDTLIAYSERMYAAVSPGPKPRSVPRGKPAARERATPPKPAARRARATQAAPSRRTSSSRTAARPVRRTPPPGASQASGGTAARGKPGRQTTVARSRRG